MYVSCCSSSLLRALFLKFFFERLPHTFLPINLTKDNVQSADDGHDIGDHHVLAEVVYGGQMREARRLDLAPVGLAGAVGHEVDAELALRSLDGRVRGAGRHGEALGEELEVVDQSLHGCL